MAKLDSKTQGLLAAAITKGIGYAENGGAPNVNDPTAGKTGEMKSIFQFEPGTWKKDAETFLDDPDAPLTPDNETTVVMRQVNQWLGEGKTAKQIASMWNAGPGEPDAYTGKFSDGSPSVGINKKYGVKFNVPAYANTVDTYAKQFYGQMSGHGQANSNPQQSSQPQQPNQNEGGNLLATIQNAARQAQAQHPATNAISQSQPNNGLLGQAAAPS